MTKQRNESDHVLVCNGCFNDLHPGGSEEITLGFLGETECALCGGDVHRKDYRYVSRIDMVLYQSRNAGRMPAERFKEVIEGCAKDSADYWDKIFIDQGLERVSGSWCPQCGPDVQVDEDGCCHTCGADATGDGADLALGYRKKLLELK